MPDDSLVSDELFKALSGLHRKIIVLDDDPTGVQTVHGVSVFTSWDREAIERGFAEPQPMFFVLTNSRSFSQEETVRVHRDIADNITRASEATGKKFILISRGDSTLRGHFPTETATLREVLEEHSSIRFDGEILFPFFKEGGRFTIANVHYVREGRSLVPAGQTEFAKDATFGYQSSDLGAWVEEKTQGAYTRASCTYISLEDLRARSVDSIVDQLLRVRDFNKVIVNAIDYIDVKIFALAFARVLAMGKEFMFRSAAAVTKVMGGVPDAPLLSREKLIDRDNRNGGLVLIGSHVRKTTQQFEALRALGDRVEFVEFNQHLVMVPGGLEREVERTLSLAANYIPQGRTIVIYTRRERFDLNTSDSEQQLAISVKISAALTSIIGRLEIRPSFIIAKGGITSSDVGTKALRVKKATVMGQIKPGIPVWMTGEESKFPRMPFIIFPGNVGDTDTLRQIVAELNPT